MFKKLRIRLILINMSLLTAVFLGIFAVVYMDTSSKMNREIEMTLNGLVDGMHKPKPQLNYLTLDLDKEGNLVQAFTPFNVHYETSDLDAIIESVKASNPKDHTIEIEGVDYEFRQQETFNGSKIALLDISPNKDMLGRLLESFLLVGTISLVLLLLISIYLTNKTIEPIKETFEKQKQFIADASHELKTPLTIINTNTSLILSSPKDTVANQAKWLNYISSQTNRMSELINEMLSLAKLDVSENQITLTPINISNIIENILLTFDAVIFESGINIETTLAKNLQIDGDQEGMKKLISIIMDNAIKHTNKGGLISVALSSSKNKAKIQIKNTGDGIADEHIDKIFERFYRVDSSRDRETGGYGLGLSIAKSIVAQHKGKIYAESNINEDTTFTIELPLKTTN